MRSVAAGQFFHTGTPWSCGWIPAGMTPTAWNGGLRRSNIRDWSNSTVEVKNLKTRNRYSLRQKSLTTNEIERVRGGGWDLPLLQSVVDQFVLHFDDAGLSRTCFLVCRTTAI